MLTLTQVWGALLILTICPLLGALPLTGWLMRLFVDRDAIRAGGGNLSVTTGFRTGGTIAGVLAVAVEAMKSIGAVLLARYYFPSDPVWEVVALIALVMGRYWSANAVGTTSLLWGAVVHSPIAAGLTLLISFLGFTIFREKQQGRLLVLVLFPLITLLQGRETVQVLLTACLCGLIGWIYQKVPEDLSLPTPATRLESQRLFGFFRSDRALHSLDTPLNAEVVGSKAAILAQLRGWGYPVPQGYVLPAGDDPAMLLEITQPSVRSPVVIRASIVGDKPAVASSAGQYTALTDVTSPEALFAGMNQCFRSYDRASAVQYRRDRDLPEGSLAVLVQQQVQGLCSGVACSRDPFTVQGEAVVIEAAFGTPSAITEGQSQPERYRVLMQPDDLPEPDNSPESWRIPEALELPVAGTGEVPQRLLQEVAFLVRHLEQRYRGIPQTIEWCFDGDRLWLLQCRPMIPPSAARAVEFPPLLSGTPSAKPPTLPTERQLTGLPICPGEVIGKVVWLQDLPDLFEIPSDAILVLPSLKASDIPVLQQVKGLIAATGGQLSNGAIAVREYGLPAVVVPTVNRKQLNAGQRIRLLGDRGLIELI